MAKKASESAELIEAKHGLFSKLLRRGQLRIRARLTACFVAIVLSMLAANLVVVWQFHRMAASGERLDRADQFSLATVLVHIDVGTLRNRLAALADTRDAAEFASEAGSLRRKFLQDVTHAQQLFAASTDIEHDPLILSTLQTLQVTLPSQVDSVMGLAALNDWPAARLRLADEVQGLVDLSSSLVERVDGEVSERRAEAMESAQRARRWLLLVLPATAFLTMLVAVLLGWRVTRTITEPVSQLYAGAQALAQGDFQHQVAIEGEDELAHLGRVFNRTAARLAALYEELRSKEARFRLIIDTIPAYVWSAEPDGSVDFINRRWLEFSGVSLEKGLGSGWEAAVHPDDLARYVDEWRAAVASGKAMESEARVRGADGQYRWLLIRNVPLHDKAGKIVKWYGTSTDIDDRKQAEEALRESETRFRTFVDHAPDALFIYDFEQGTIVEANRQACESLGYTRQELIRTAAVAFHLDSDRPPMESVAQRAAAGETVIDTHWHLRKDGTLFPVEVHTSQYWYGGRRFLLKVARDISDRKRAEEELQRSEAYLAEAQRLTHTGSWAFDVAAQKTVYWSEEMFRIFGFDPHQPLPADETQLRRIHPEDLNRVVAGFDKSHRAGVDTSDEFRIVLPDGTLKHVHVITHPVLNDAGDVVKLIGTLVDITERKRAEEALRRSEAYLAEGQRLSHTGSFAWSAATRQSTYWSEEQFRIFGLNPQEGVPTSETFWQRIHPEDLDRTRELLLTAADRSMEYEHDHRIVLPDGTVKHIHAIGHPVFDENGQLAGYVGTAVDVTERKRAEEERERLRQLEADLAHLNRVSMLGELAASIAHEVNQPLSGVVSNGSACLRFLARDTPNLEEAREAARDIVRDGKRAGEVIARIRALATKRAATQKEELDLNGTIREVLALVGNEAKKKSVITRTQFADDLSPVSGDRVQLQQVLLNLVMNAIEAMSSVGDRAGELVITTRNIDPDQVQVTVEDSGIGLDPNTIAKIFDPFYTTKPGGMGMGLSISRSILQAHGGRLWATVNDGPGTTFHFTLPKYEGEEESAGVAAV